MIGRTIRYFAEIIARKNKQHFIKSFSNDWLSSSVSSVNFNIISFSGSKQLCDQLYSIASFYRNVGKPISWVVYNDGSYKDEELSLLSKIPRVKVRPIILQPGGLPDRCFKDYPTLYKIEILKQLKDFSNTILFVDSDVLFYKNFKDYIPDFSKNNWYIIDEGKGYFDPEFVMPEMQKPLNLGFLILNKYSDLSSVIEYLSSKIEQGKLHYWSDQTAMHILAQNEKFHVLPVDQFVVGGKDGFRLSHCVDYNEISVRHFVGPVRHKMWQYSWKKILGIK